LGDYGFRTVPRGRKRFADDCQGTLPLAIFGPVGYGLRNGILAAPARAAQAASPLIFGLLIDWMGVGAVAISAGVSIAALLALMALRARTSPAAMPSQA
jgi:hypothetical protein